MDNPIREQGASTQSNLKSFFASLPIFDNIIKWLASLIKLTEADVEDAGIHFDRLKGE